LVLSAVPLVLLHSNFILTIPVLTYYRLSRVGVEGAGEGGGDSVADDAAVASGTPQSPAPPAASGDESDDSMSGT
jgi:hypothetical protein